MAEETKNIYKYKGEDMDRDLLVKNLRHNVQNYMNNRGWDESKRKEFSDAYEKYIGALENGRLSSTDLGNILDSAGELDNGVANYRDKNGKVLSQEEYDALKKRKRKGVTNDFYANREVATYIDKVANSVYNHTKKEPETPTKFDYGTHGLWNQFKRSLNPTGNVDIQAWWNFDPYDTENKTRGTQNRANYLSNYINTYRDQLAEGLDFSETPGKTREAYLEQLANLQEELKNGVDDTDYRLLSAMGINPAEYRTFFNTTSKDYDPNNPMGISTGGEETPEETPEQKQAREEEEEKTKLNKQLQHLAQERASKYNEVTHKLYRSPTTPTGFEYNTKLEDLKERLESYMNQVNNEKGSDFFSVEALKNTNGEDYLNYLEQFGELHPGTVKEVQSGGYRGWRYFPESYNDENGSVLAYDPKTHRVGRLYYNNLDREAHDTYAKILQGVLDESSYDRHSFLQEGGNIEAAGYQPASSLSEFTERARNRSKQTKADPKLRRPWKEGTDYSDNKFTATDKARLAAIAADIAAVVDPDPTSSAVLGIGSDITNLVSDLNEGYGIGKSLGNFGANLALSAVGIIPIFGQAAGSGGKVVKSIIKMAPKLRTALLTSGVLAAASNGAELKKSLDKIGKDGVENEMNVEDWRNVATCIQLALGGAHAVRSAHTAKKLKEIGGTGQQAVRVIDKEKLKQTGSVKESEKTLLFGNKETIKELNAAKAKGPEAVQEVIDSYKSMKGRYVLPTEETSSRKFFSSNPKFKIYKPWTWSGKVKGTKVSDDYISDFIDYQAIRRAYNNGKLGGSNNIFSRWWNAELNYLGKHGNYGWNLNTIPATNRVYAKHAAPVRNKATTPKATERPATTATPKAAAETAKNTSKLTSKEFTANARKARAYYNNQKGNISKKPHSPEGQRLIDSGVSEARLMAAKMWKEGGRIDRVRKIIKAAGGDTTRNFNTPVSYSDKNYETWRRNFLILPQTYSTVNGRRNYGAGYESNINYANGEYGVDVPVDISAIRDADPGTRSDNLSPEHKAEGYDYGNAQANTDKARGVWQANENNRLNDFANWARAWYDNSENKNKSQAQMLADYNKAIDSMYTFKREMGTNYTGKNSYRTDKSVGEFNRTNRAIYGTANAIGGVHGYDEGSENINGTTTAQRFIDITDKDLTDLDWSKIFKEGDTEEFRNLFRGLAKDTTGRYYTQEGDILNSTVNSPVSPTETPASTSTGTPSDDSLTLRNEEEGSGSTNNKKPFDWQSIYTGLAPDTLAIGRYLAARNLNKNLLNIAKNMPVMLYNPNERHLWQRGDHTAIQEGYKALGQLNHLAAQPISADAAQQQATAMEANIKGQPYVNQGYATNDATSEKTKQASWVQEGENQDSRYSTATKNLENLFNHRAGVLEALGNYKRSNYESLNGLLGEYENRFRTRQEELSGLQDNLMKASIENRIMSNLGDYNVSAADQELFNSVQNGERQYTDLSDAERAIYDRISSMISERVTQEYAISKGLSYTPYLTPARRGGRDTIEFIGVQRQGGVLDGDSEKITIQKLRAKVSKMAIRQRQLEARLNAYEKDMERSYKSASQYVKSQKKSK